MKKRNIYNLFVFLIFCSFSTFAQKETEIAKQQLKEKKITENTDNQLLTQRDINEMIVSSAYHSPSTGWFHIYFNQRLKDIEVYNAQLNVVLKNDKVVHVGNQFVPKIDKLNHDATPTVTATQALSLVATHLGLVAFQADLMSEEKLPNGTIFKTTFQNTNLTPNDIKAQLYWLPNAEKTAIQLVWNISIETPNTSNWWNVRLNAQTGEIVEQNDYVVHCNFDKPNTTCHHHDAKEIENLVVKGANNASEKPSFAFPNDYVVFDIPLESPRHGARTTVNSPYTRFVPAATFPGPTNGWHDNGTTAFTHTQGNNVLAQDDTDNNNTTAGNRPTSATLDFDYPYTFGPGTAGINQNAAITNLFYWNNLIHDILYQMGFDEPSGNYQSNNMGRGGLGNDFVNADAQDGGGTNNANFSSGVDGVNGRMQMYLWSSTGGAPTFTVNSPTVVAGNYAVAESNFSINNKLTGTLTGNLVLVDDAGAATTSLGCTAPFDNTANIAGNIAVIDRGTCSFIIKAKNAQLAGAIGVLVINNVTGNPTAMSGTDNTITIPAFMISQTNGNLLKAQLTAGQTVNATFQANGYQPDGDFDNGIIAHEYGHGWSNRLTGGPANSGCLTNTEQMGEGWSDFLGLMLTTDWAAQTPTIASANVSRGIGTYAIGQPTTGGGIRPFPYSYDKANINNTVTYGSVANTSFSAPHGIGSIWCTMLWDMAWEIIFLDNAIEPNIWNKNNMIGNVAALKLVNEGLRLQKCGPSFIDGRDAILKADELLFNGKYKCAIWKAFARRGLGANATTGTSASDRIITENFSMPTGVTIKKDANINAAPEGSNVTYTLTVTCGCSNTTVDVIDQMPTALTYVPNSANLGGVLLGSNIQWSNQAFNPLEVKTYTFQATVANNIYQPIVAAINDDLEGSTPSGAWANFAITGTTNFTTSGTTTHSGTAALFAPNVTAATGSTTDFYSSTGTSYAINGPATFSFWHNYNTEADWDGGVVEISINGGSSWIDLGPYFITNGYNGAVGAVGRNGFSGNSNGWIKSVANLKAFCGTTALFRFRMFNDDNTLCASGNCGWFIDDITLNVPTGIKNDAVTTSNTSSSNCIEITQNLGFPKLAAKVFLNHYANGLMSDYLRIEPNFPKIDPYSSLFSSNFVHVNNTILDSTSTSVLTVTGNDAIVDWVFLELRTGISGATSVVRTKAALLQKDGDIVDMDGASPITFNGLSSGNYYIAVRHHNHLSFRTDAVVALSSTPAVLDFSNNSVLLYGATPLTALSPTISAMSGGDANSDGSIDGIDSAMWELQNGLFDDYTLNSDYNLDGSIDGIDSAIWELNNGKYQELD